MRKWNGNDVWTGSEAEIRGGGISQSLGRKRREENAMRRIWEGLIVIVIVLLITPVVNAEFYTGQKLVEDWKAYKAMTKPKPLKSPKLIQGMAHYMGYVVGVIDSNYDLIFFPPDVTVEQIFEAVGNYLEAHPDQWKEPAVNLVLQALQEHLDGKESKDERAYRH
jgi:hypothetical protein